MKAKILVLAAVLLSSQSIFAGDVSLAWDPNTEPELVGYKLCYGTSSGQYSTQLDVGNVTTYTVASVSAGTYYFAVKAYGIGGLESAFSNEVSTTVSSTGDTTPPTISGVTSSGVTTSGATINWTTNEASDTQVDYGLTTGYGSSTTLSGTMVTSHSQALSGLTASTTYHYRVRSRDAAGNLATSGDYTFTTAAPPDTTPPTISSVTSSGITTTGATITWTTNEASDTQVDYGLTASYGSSTTLNGSMVTSHSQALSGLTVSTTYHYRVKSRDAAGNLATSGDYTFTTATPPDTTPPTITAVTSSGITSSGATITWTTNEPSNSRVNYGLTTSYGSSTVLDGSMVTSHSQTISGLTASTTYHYRVRSRDAASNLATSGDYTFTTAAPPDTTPPTISSVTGSGITSSGATITWNTNEASDAQVDYGLTASYGSSTTLNGSMVTSHSQSLSGLMASTTYHYRVKSRDAAGNLATSGDYTFTTAAPPDTLPPVIGDVTSSGITRTGATINWITDEESNSQVEYGLSTDYGSSAVLDGSMVTTHSQTLSGLTDSTIYHYRIRSRDAAGNLATSGDYTFTTAAPPDILWRNTETGDNVIWHMDGVTYLGFDMLPPVSDQSWTIVGRADFNNDGKLDIVWRNTETGNNVVWHMDGATYIDSSTLPGVADQSWTIAGTADLNNDGKPDLVWRNTSTGENVVWFMDGGTYIGFDMLPGVAEQSWTIAGIADFNNDGKPDIVWRNADTGDNAVWHMDGVQYIGFDMLPGVGEQSWTIVRTGDLNNDGKPDIVWRNTNTGDNVVWYMDGATYTGFDMLPGVGEQCWKIVGR